MARESPDNPQPPAGRLERQVQDLRVETRTEFTQLRGEMNQGFSELRGEMNQLRGEMNQVRGEMKEGFARTDARLDAMQRTMVQAAVAMTAAILAGFGGILALLATQL